MTTRRLQLLLAACLATCVCTFTGLVATSDATAQRSVLCERKDPALMKVENTSARLIHLNLGTSVIPIAPLQTVTILGDDAIAAKAVLDGPFSGLVSNGDLVIDGKAKAAPASLEPTQPSTGAPPMPPQQPSDEAVDRDTEPVPAGAAQQPPPAEASAPASSVSGGGTRKR